MGGELGQIHGGPVPLPADHEGFGDILRDMDQAGGVLRPLQEFLCDFGSRCIVQIKDPHNAFRGHHDGLPQMQTGAAYTLTAEEVKKRLR